ncbi:MAG: hypothetical protein WCB27_09330 [Thermoguttaceae bacterium]
METRHGSKTAGNRRWGGSCTATPGSSRFSRVAVQPPPQRASLRSRKLRPIFLDQRELRARPAPCYSVLMDGCLGNGKDLSNRGIPAAVAGL